jgi:hypothetical protein
MRTGLVISTTVIVGGGQLCVERTDKAADDEICA